MNPDYVMDIVQRATWTVVEVAGPLLAIGISVGLFMGLIQAATQISEPALTFVPKMGALAFGLFTFGSWVSERLVSFSREMFTSIGNF